MFSPVYLSILSVCMFVNMIILKQLIKSMRLCGMVGHNPGTIQLQFELP